MALADKVFGGAKTNDFRDAFDEADKTGSGRIPFAQVGPALRAQGLCPTEAALKGFKASVGPPKFLVDDLSLFFLPFDPANTGQIDERVFRNLMLNMGEPFTEKEIDVVLAEMNFTNGVVRYVEFLENITKHKAT
eukprot:GEMP01116479.1.p1 GENE.GEMP01116479.1~~GEMP01116479.1.p1  ORF type:complete len:147 (+),score=35.98 GEMP01116479.1:38-442(+)